MLLIVYLYDVWLDLELDRTSVLSLNELTLLLEGCRSLQERKLELKLRELLGEALERQLELLNRTTSKGYRNDLDFIHAKRSDFLEAVYPRWHQLACHQ